jgi:peptide/nickel transport system substrate-binding protein
VQAVKNKEVLGVTSIDAQRLSGDASLAEMLSVHSIAIPHYFAVFFNQTKSVPLAYNEVREALVMATNRTEIIERALFGYGDEVQSLFLPNTPGFQSNLLEQQNSVEQARQLLEDNGWTEEEDGIRKKEDVRLEFTLVVPDWPEAIEAANVVQEQWRSIGAQMNVQTVGVYELGKNFIQTREYDALLFANVTSIQTDPLVFWHSEHKKDPGRNFALYEDEEADKLLIDARKTIDEQARGDMYKQWQDVVNKTHPAVYLFSTKYLYPVSSKVQGMQLERISTPSDRFSQVEMWYIKTKRIFK